MTDYLELATLDFWFRNTAFGKPAGLAISWHTATPGDTGSIAAEIGVNAGGAGGREPITFNNSTARNVDNTAQIDIVSSAAAGLCTYVGIHRTDLAQQMLGYIQLGTPIDIQIGSPIRINAGGLDFDWPDTNSQGLVDGIIDAWLSHVFGSTTATSPTSVYTSIHSGDPLQTGVNEFTTADYARQLTAWDAAAQATTGDTTDSWTRNTSELNWTNLNDTPISWWGAWDAATTGTFIARRNQVDDPISPGSNGNAAAQALEVRVN
jgi:hypothetical protein